MPLGTAGEQYCGVRHSRGSPRLGAAGMQLYTPQLETLRLGTSGLLCGCRSWTPWEYSRLGAARSTRRTCTPQNQTCTCRGGGGEHVHFFMKRRSENGLRMPKNGFQRAQKPAICRPNRPPRHPKRHRDRPLVTPVFEARKETSRKPSCCGVWPAKHGQI